MDELSTISGGGRGPEDSAGGSRDLPHGSVIRGLWQRRYITTLMANR